jgi:hypothetical protein
VFGFRVAVGVVVGWDHLETGWLRLPTATLHTRSTVIGAVCVTQSILDLALCCPSPSHDRHLRLTTFRSSFVPTMNLDSILKMTQILAFLGLMDGRSRGGGRCATPLLSEHQCRYTLHRFQDLTHSDPQLSIFHMRLLHCSCNPVMLRAHDCRALTRASGWHGCW